MSNNTDRRTFMATGAAAAASALIYSKSAAQPSERPNILWISSEDNGPHLGCYGHEYSDTPNLDRLASRGVIYNKCWSTAPVCAPARTAIISGVYPPSTGSQHMRSIVEMPSFMKMFPQYLREAGYYCSNNRKEDYNLMKNTKVWDDSSRQAHWRNRGEGQPFFSVFNFTTTHESQIRRRPHEQKHDPDQVPLPDYHPDTPEVRQDWAQYYDKLTEMDAQAGELMRQLEEDGLAENTIIFYWGDHGPGMPRCKRWTYNSGLHVPLIVHVPEKFQHLAPEGYQPGGELDRLVGFIDFAPTVLSIVGIEPPDYMQGHAFMGAYAAPAPRFQFGFRDRMDERYDMCRSVRNDRYVYVRNYKPHKVYGQYLAYMFQTPTTVVWKRMYDEGKLNPAQSIFWETKPAEELFDLENDPYEVNNLATNPNFQDVLEELRLAEQAWVKSIRDVGFLPENEMHSRAGGATIYEMAQDESLYPMEKIMAAAERASSLEYGVSDDLRQSLWDRDSAVRYWGILGFIMRGKPAVQDSIETIRQALNDPAESVRVAAGEALGRYGTEADGQAALEVLLDLSDQLKHDVHIAAMALNAIVEMGDKAKPALSQIESLPTNDPDRPGRASDYPQRLIQQLKENLG